MIVTPPRGEVLWEALVPTVTGGFPPPPPTVPTYTLTTSDPDGSAETDPIPITEPSYSELLDDSWTASWKCPEHVPPATRDNLAVGRRVRLYRNEALRWSGRLWSAGGSSEDGPTYVAYNLYEVLKYRYLLPPDVLTYESMNPWDMAWDVISYANAQGGLDITEGDRIGLDPHDFSTEFHWWDGQSIADMLQAIAQLPYLAYDYYLDGQDPPAWHVVRRTGPESTRDPNPDVVLERGVNIEKISFAEELIDTGTQVLSVGANEGASMLYSLSEVENDDLYGLLQIFDASAQTRFGQRDQDFLDFHNSNVLAAQKWPQNRVTVSVNLAAVDWDQARLGDVITIRYYDDPDPDADTSLVRVDGAYVLAQRTVKVSAAGREESQWTFLTPDRFRG